MTPELSTYLYIGATLIAAFVYYMTFRYQAKKIDILEKAIKTQSTLLDDFDKFKKLLDVDHYVKNRDLQLENQKIELTRLFEKESLKIANGVRDIMAKSFVDVNAKWLASFNELAQIPISIVMKQFPEKEHKNERDAYIKEKFPHSSEFFIGFCDAWVAGEIPPDDPVQ